MKKNPESPADNLLTAENDALSLDCDAWRRVMEGLGEPRFRADQICQWIYGHKVMTIRQHLSILNYIP